MSDEADRATASNEVIESARIARARALCGPEQVQRKDGSWPVLDCVDCGEQIEAGRLALGRIRCVYCQEQLEKRRKTRR